VKAVLSQMSTSLAPALHPICCGSRAAWGGGRAEADFYGGGRFSAVCQFFGCQFFLLAFKGGAKNRPGRVPVQFSGLAVQFSGFARPIFLSTRPADLAGQFFGVFRFFNYTKISKEIKNWNSQK